jgi:signal transduction histidine kinase
VEETQVGTSRRRRRADTLPLVAQPGAPRVCTIGLDPALDKELAGLLGTSEVIPLDPAGDLGESVDAEEPDLVFVRVGEGGEGLGFVREMKLVPDTHFLPIIAVGAPATRLAALAAGVDHWVELPLPADELRARGDALMRSAAIARAMSQSRQELRLRRDWVRYLVHDLRNFLTKAIGDLALATRKAASDPEAAQHFVQRCEEELWRCSSLLGDLLDVDRIRKGQLQVRRSATDLVALAGRVAETFKEAAARGEVALLVAARTPAVIADVDGALVERVLSNLVSNALRFAPRGTPIGVELSGGEGKAVLEVENRGPSIPPEKMSEIFEPFVKNDDRPNAAGAGLGLAFCRLAVDLHGGTISVLEPDGGGARFRVELPLSTS